jgi:hypothetical protein
MRTVEKGWEGPGAALEGLQAKAEGELHKQLAGRLSHRFSTRSSSATSACSIHQARLLDAADVYVEAAASRSDLRNRIDAAQTVMEIDGTGRVLGGAVRHARTRPPGTRCCRSRAASRRTRHGQR